MSIFLTGDIHGEQYSIKRLAAKRFDAKTPTPLTRDDYVIILGDFGFVWSDPPSREETYWLNWLNDRPWTTLVVLGNHENHELVRALPTEPWRGGRVRRFREHVLQLADNEVFELDGKSFFVRGGARTEDHDRAEREKGKTWWPEEVPDAAERAAALAKLDAVGRRVDFALTHEAPAGLFGALYPASAKEPREPNEYAEWLQTIADRLDFGRWFFGHHHQNRYDLGRFTALYGDVAELDGKPSARAR